MSVNIETYDENPTERERKERGMEDRGSKEGPRFKGRETINNTKEIWDSPSVTTLKTSTDEVHPISPVKGCLYDYLFIYSKTLY